MQSQTKTPHVYAAVLRNAYLSSDYLRLYSRIYRLCRHDIKFIQKVTTRKNEREVILATILQSFH